MDVQRVRCYRGVAKYNPQYQDALQGNANPRGGSASPADHNDGDTRSEYTSWTLSYRIALEKATDQELGGKGIILQKDFDAVRLIPSPDAYLESEVFVWGPITGALVTEAL